MRRNLKFGTVVMMLVASLLLPSVAVLAQGDAIVFVPFESESFGLQGVVPEGWTTAAPGVVQRLAAPGDLTSVIQQAVPGITPDVLGASLLSSLGLTALPEPDATLETAAFAWTVYHMDVSAGGVTVRIFLALAATDNGAALVLVQGDEAEADMLHDAIFTPVIDALAPLQPAEAAVSADYVTEDVSFDNAAVEEVTLAGTLSLPAGEGPHPAVILISGSGPSDRDESLLPIAEMKPFALIADALTQAGIAVLRYDDRGVGESTGDYASATSADLATDAEAALAYMLTRDDIRTDQIGLLGHSEGGLIAPMVAARHDEVAFVIALSGGAVSGFDVMIRQNELVLSAAGASEEAIAKQVDWVSELFEAVIAEEWNTVESLLRTNFEEMVAGLSEEQRTALGDTDAYIDAQVEAQLAGMNGWMRYFIMYDPAPDWAQVSVPVLAFFGGLDMQVDAAQNQPVLEAVLADAGNEDVTTVFIEEANHLFQPAITGAVQEYGTLPQEFVPELLPTITAWLLDHIDVAG